MRLRTTGSLAVAVSAEPSLLRAMLDNLIGNALKCAQVGGQIEIGVQRSDHGTVLFIRDDGPGVPVEQRRHLTERFFRGTVGNETGSGLGLSIVERIASRFQAVVSFSDGLHGRGLTVAVTFPADRHTADV